jgi:hypothetical protein
MQSPSVSKSWSWKRSLAWHLRCAAWNVKRRFGTYPPVRNGLLWLHTLYVIVQPFDLMRTATDQRELIRLAWWLRQIYPTQCEPGGYENTVIFKGWGVHLIPSFFRGLTYIGLPLSKRPFYDIEIGLVFGLCLDRVASLKNIERMTMAPWRRTACDLPRAEQGALNADILSALVVVVAKSPVTGRGELARRVFLFLARRMRPSLPADADPGAPTPLHRPSLDPRARLKTRLGRLLCGGCR